MVSTEDKNFALLAHLLGLFTSIVAPLLIWLLKKDSAYVERHAREAVNFHISLIIYYFVAGILCILLIGFVLLPLIGLLHLVCTILASVKAYNGEEYRYPLTIRLLK
ncbi:hypothetical protein SY83_12845 [Paenibacillus swuensis]|uniref:DUF4870 domain-containing protein n=1 Tax=Paenibacillus swuensis TaxID=1178515 RepID=A0A172TIW7_9BACL|nr:DUF4870 domain-containing protein [Paenibacillus swuensis]ANE47009.1 hypothetical protein SY83_12845 [Paenibacillus swuensis]